MNWREEWSAISARLEGIRSATEVLLQALAVDSGSKINTGPTLKSQIDAVVPSPRACEHTRGVLYRAGIRPDAAERAGSGRGIITLPLIFTRTPPPSGGSH